MSFYGEIERDISKPDVTYISDYQHLLRLARIVDVYDASYLESTASKDKSRYGKVRILWLDGSGYVPQDLDVSKSWFSWKRGATIAAMPEIDDIVVCLKRPSGYPVVLGFLPYRWDSASSKIRPISDDTVGSIKPLYKGEILLKSSSQGEIYLTKQGNIKISTYDPSDVSNVVTDLNSNCTEQLFRRVNNNNKVVECTLGYDFLSDGVVKPAGTSPQIFSVGTHIKTNLTISFPYEKEIQFFLYEDTELVEIRSLTISSQNKGISGTESIEKSRYDLKATAIYTPGSADASTETLNPCTTEKNSYIYTIKFNDTVKHQSTDVVTLELITKKFVGGLRVNSCGDVFIDGRNVVIRSKDGKSSAKFSEDGQTLIRGTSTTTGNIYEGSVRCDSSGVKLYKGIYSGSDILQENPESVVDSTASYFYVTDYYPLLKLYKSFGTWNLDGVTLEEYSSLDDNEKTGIEKMWVSPKESSDAPSQSFLTGLIKKGFPSYAELKSQV